MQTVTQFVRKVSAIFLLFSSIAQADISWDSKFYNPKPMADDVILPLPCGGAMAFRKIFVSAASGPLADQAITLGQDDSQWGYLMQARPTHIAGSFTTDKEGRYYLLAKYDLTRLQYQALTDKTCPKPSLPQRAPQTQISWVDAMQLADTYNQWLRTNAVKQIPQEDGKLGFIRLPTETEWEFAARGGIKVSESEFRDLMYPMDGEELNQYEWYAGAQSSNGELQLTGLLHPNPLGLFDMLGNVQEMMFESFSLDKLNRLHGQAGGYIVRGGSYLTPESQISSAARSERPYYDAENIAQSDKQNTVGVRFALVSDILTSAQRIKEIEKQWASLGSQTPSIKGKQSEQVDPQKHIADIAQTVNDKKLKQDLENLRTELRANTMARDEQRDQAIRSSLQLGAFLCTELKNDGLYADNLQEQYDKLCSNQDPDNPLHELAQKNCPSYQEKIQSHQKVLDFLVNYYADNLVGVTLNYSYDQVDKQIPLVLQQLQARKSSNLSHYLTSYWDNLKEYFHSGRIRRSEWLNTCKKTQ